MFFWWYCNSVLRLKKRMLSKIVRYSKKMDLWFKILRRRREYDRQQCTLTSLDYRLWWITIWFGGCNMLIFIFLVFAKSFEILQWKFAVCTKICFPLVLLKSRSYQGYSQRNTVQPRFAKGVWSRKVLSNKKWKWKCKKEGCNLKQCFLFSSQKN